MDTSGRRGNPDLAHGGFPQRVSESVSTKGPPNRFWKVKGATMTPKTYESLAQAAERTSLSVKTLRRRIAAGKLRAYRDGPKILRVDPKDVDQMLRPLRVVAA
jgi:excisionase family DNA binding protein